MPKNTEEIVEVTKEQQNEIIRTYENDILAGMLKAADFRDDPDEIVNIEIIRKGVLLFSFHIRPLSEDEFTECRKKSTNYVRNKQVGTKVAESVNGAQYRARAIYTATVDEDKEKTWDNHNLWRQLGVNTGIDVIDAVLKGGEKSSVYDKIEEISAYNDDLEGTTKN